MVIKIDSDFIKLMRFLKICDIKQYLDPEIISLALNIDKCFIYDIFAILVNEHTLKKELIIKCPKCNHKKQISFNDLQKAFICANCQRQAKAPLNYLMIRYQLAKSNK